MVTGCMLLPAAPYAAAQSTTASITGTVTDNTGATIPNAKVTLTDLGTKQTRTTVTTSSGDYDFSQLNPGSYSIAVIDTGFQTFSYPSVTVAAGDRAREDAKLSVGAEATTVQVTAQTPALQTDSSVIQHVVTEAAVQNLPLSGRNYINLAQITPGASEGPGNGLTSGARPDDRRQTSAVVANGQSEILNNETIDGLDNNERIIGGIGVRPSIDAIREISIQTNTYTAEVGRTGGAVINIITKSGTNAFHGSAYEFFQNDVLNANPYNFGHTLPNGRPLPKPKLRQNQFGGSIGGPIVHDKVFFFGDYEGLRQIQGQNPSTNQTITNDQYDTLHSGNPAAIAALAGGPVDPAGLNYALLYPRSNSTTGGTDNTAAYISNPTQTRNSDTADGRVDWQIDQKDLIFGRFTYNNVPFTLPGLLPNVTQNGVTVSPGGNVYAFQGAAKDTAQNTQINFVRTISPTVLLQLGFGYTRVNNQSSPLNYGVNASQAFGLPGVNLGDQVTSGLTPIFVGSLASLGSGNFIPIIDIDNTFQEAGSLSINHGKQSIKVGAELIRRQATNIQNNFGIGSYGFNPLQGATGQAGLSGLTALLQGRFNNVERSNSLAPPHYREWEPAVYFQDDYRASNDLTLNLGVRYEVLTPFTEVKNALTNFDPTTGTLLVAGRNGVNNYAGLNPTYANVGPRLGFAYTAAPGLVFRGGFGMSFFQSNYTSNGSEKAQPFVSDYKVTNPNTGAFTPFSAGLPAPTASSATNPSGNINDVLNKGFRTSYLEQFNLTVEKAFGANVFQATYVGELGRHLAQITNDQNAPALISNTALQTYANQLGTDTGTAFNLLRPYHNTLPNANQIGQFTSTGVSNYQALQLSLTRRATKGLTLGANYTYSHNLDNILSYSNEVNDGYGDVPSQLSTLEYGNSDLDLRNRLAVTGDYVLPFGQNLTGYKAALGKGWQANTLLVWNSGIPFTVLEGNGVTSTNQAANQNVRPNQVRKANRSGFNLNQFFDTAAFEPQLSGTLGSERRNPLYGPHFRHVDLSLFKSFPVYRESTLEFRAEAFNIINTTNFGQPNNTFNAQQTYQNSDPTAPNYVALSTDPRLNLYNYQSSTVGEIQSTSANYTPREIQFALKYQF